MRSGRRSTGSISANELLFFTHAGIGARHISEEQLRKSADLMMHFHEFLTPHSLFSGARCILDRPISGKS